MGYCLKSQPVADKILSSEFNPFTAMMSLENDQ